jgi:uncharacterized protein (TIGR00661 family)
MPRLRLAFVVQGDGRGHLTQALAVRDLLAAAGHEVSACLVGVAPGREIPNFFYERIGGPVVPFESFDLVTDRRDRRLSFAATLGRLIVRTPHLVHDGVTLRRTLTLARPDVILNFYDSHAGLSFHLFRPPARVVCVANQYLLDLPGVPYPDDMRASLAGLRALNRLTAPRGATRLACSLRPRADHAPLRVRVIPPLLRRTVLDAPAPTDEGFLLVYLLKMGVYEDLLAWHARHPGVRVKCYADHPPASGPPVADTLTFHPLADGPFVADLARCRGLVCSSGFQSLAEAMWFGKPVLAVPVGGHVEQACNAAAVTAYGAGVASATLDPGRLLDYLPRHRPDTAAYRAWVATGADRVVRAVEAAAQR